MQCRFLRLCAVLLAVTAACSAPQQPLSLDQGEETAPADLARMFAAPPAAYRPYVWWHWMGSNFSKEGITRDLEAMKEAGIAGATIFNLTSAVQESECPVGNLPWPEQTYRSEAYWEAIAHAAAEAERLGLKIGLHNCPGYSTTGGPWITEDQGMQKVLMRTSDIRGGAPVRLSLPVPDLPSFSFYTDFVAKASRFHDIAVMAVPLDKAAEPVDVLDLSGQMDASGTLAWDAPEGTWRICRIGYAATMAFPHPVPEEILGKVLEADKMDAAVSSFHWDNVLEPLKAHVGKYFGKSFTHILVDSYEAGDQDWTPDFRERFTQLKGYDPAVRLALKAAAPDAPLSKAFDADMKAVVNRLFLDAGFAVARDKIHEMGLDFYWEPYSGPFDTGEAVALADLPMGEFWTGGDGKISSLVVDKAREYGKNIVGAEAFTGWPTNSRYTEDPAFLKRSADGAFVSGANLLFLHHWVHQPFDDRYQPGMGMGWWGTHFGRNQTWFEPGKAFFTYLSRCQMMLRQGALEERTGAYLHRRTKQADIYFAVNQDEKQPVTLTLAPEDTTATPQYWDPYTGVIREAPLPAQRDSIRLTLGPGEAMFVVLDHGGRKYPVEAARTFSGDIRRIPLPDIWDVEFAPKRGEPFHREGFRLQDLGAAQEECLKYFAGTARYSTTIDIGPDCLGAGTRVFLDLGLLNDIASLQVNGKEAGVLWYPPYKTDITDFLRMGRNTLSVAVTNNWANRLIGDEQAAPDFEWGADRGENMGQAMKAFPEWFLKGEERPSKDRKTFVIWSYYRKGSPLQHAGLEGPVQLELREISSPISRSGDRTSFEPIGTAFPMQSGLWKGTHPGLLSYNVSGSGAAARFDDSIWMEK